MWSILDVLKVLALLIMPWTSYPRDRRYSARYDPSCPVIPVINAFFVNYVHMASNAVSYQLPTMSAKTYKHWSMSAAIVRSTVEGWLLAVT